jgi:hypothetical protein
VSSAKLITLIEPRNHSAMRFARGTSSAGEPIPKSW